MMSINLLPVSYWHEYLDLMFFFKAINNSLPEHLRLDHLSLTLFKKSLLEYYHNALVSCYDVDDARTWKTVCLKCNTSRNLIDADPCCY
jgi:hypothetical protein